VTPDAPYFVAIARAAEQVQRSERTIRGWVMDGQVRSARVGHTLMVDLADVVKAEVRAKRMIDKAVAKAGADKTRRTVEDKLRNLFGESA
jgi:hypothetical protein